ncbi:O-Antigen ligase [compost metagenome]
MGRFAILWIVIAIFVCCTSGMFFLDTLPSLWLISLSLAAAAGATLMKMMGLRVKDNGGILRNKMNLRELSVSRSILIISWGPFLFAVMYTVHLLSNNALAVHATKLSAICWLFYAAIGVLLYLAVGSRGTRNSIERGWCITTGLLALTALGAVYGIVPVPYAILRSANPEITASGARLGGLLQYPNAFGAIMGAALVERLMSLAGYCGTAYTSSSRWQRFSTGALTLVFMLCMLLSESRGAYMAVAAGWAAGYMLLPAQQRQRYLLQTGVYAAAGALLSRQLAAAQLAPPLLPGLLVLAATMAAALALSGLAARRAASAQAARFYRSAALLGAGGALYWIAQHARLLQIDTLSARLAMYRDALKLFQASPWVGQGGDTWKTAYLSIQQGPYVGSEMHSGYIDIALDLGVTGLGIALCWLGSIVTMLYRRKSRMLAPLIVLLFHSAVDFDMSYGMFWVIVITLAGLGLSEHLVEPDGTIRKQLKQEWVIHKGVIYGLIAATFIAGSLLSLRMAEGLRLYHASCSSPDIDPAAKKQLLKDSLTLDPARTDSRMALAALSPPDKAIALLKQGIVYDRGNDKLWLALGTSLAHQGSMDAVTALRQATILNPYNRSLQTDVLHQIYLLALRLRSQQHYEEARAAALAGYQMYEDYSRLSEEIKRSPMLRNDRGFTMTKEAEIRGRELGLIAFPFHYASAHNRYYPPKAERNACDNASRSTSHRSANSGLTASSHQSASNFRLLPFSAIHSRFPITFL